MSRCICLVVENSSVQYYVVCIMDSDKTECYWCDEMCGLIYCFCEIEHTWQHNIHMHIETSQIIESQTYNKVGCDNYELQKKFGLRKLEKSMSWKFQKLEIHDSWWGMLWYSNIWWLKRLLYNNCQTFGHVWCDNLIELPLPSEKMLDKPIRIQYKYDKKKHHACAESKKTKWAHAQTWSWWYVTWLIWIVP